jgi:hypothetical protein
MSYYIILYYIIKRKFIKNKGSCKQIIEIVIKLLLYVAEVIF